MKLLLDLDSTLFPLLDAMRTRPGGERVTYADCPSWNGLADLCTGGVPGMLDLFDQVMTYDVMSKVGMFDGAAHAVQQLAADGVEIHVATTRKPEFADDTARYLHDHRIPFAQLDCYQPMDKLQICAERDIRVVVDDHPDLLAQAATSPVTALTLRWRYNADVVDEHNVPHATTWTDLAPLIRRELQNAYAAVRA